MFTYSSLFPVPPGSTPVLVSPDDVPGVCVCVHVAEVAVYMRPSQFLNEGYLQWKSQPNSPLPSPHISSVDKLNTSSRDVFKRLDNGKSLTHTHTHTQTHMHTLIIRRLDGEEGWRDHA